MTVPVVTVMILVRGGASASVGANGSARASVCGKGNDIGKGWC